MADACSGTANHGCHRQQQQGLGKVLGPFGTKTNVAFSPSFGGHLCVLYLSPNLLYLSVKTGSFLIRG